MSSHLSDNGQRCHSHTWSHAPLPKPASPARTPSSVGVPPSSHPRAPGAGLFWKAQPERTWLGSHPPGSNPGAALDVPSSLQGPALLRAGSCHVQAGRAWGGPGTWSSGLIKPVITPASYHLTSQTPPCPPTLLSHPHASPGLQAHCREPPPHGQLRHTRSSREISPTSHRALPLESALCGSGGSPHTLLTSSCVSLSSLAVVCSPRVPAHRRPPTSLESRATLAPRGRHTVGAQ